MIIVDQGSRWRPSELNYSVLSLQASRYLQFYIVETLELLGTIL